MGYLKYTPEHVYVVSKEPVSYKAKKFFDKRCFEYSQSITIADDKIIKLLNLKKFNNTNFTIISSDSDFSKVILKLLDDDKKVHLITRHQNNKRILMNLPLTNKDLKIDTRQIIRRLIDAKRVIKGLKS